jgi:hypothetical protein
LADFSTGDSSIKSGVNRSIASCNWPDPQKLDS